MQTKEYGFSFEIYDNASELQPDDAALLERARRFTAQAYVPYSHFRVGAAARLTNGEIVSGANQENASFPAGLCAERVLLATASSLFPGVPIDTLAVSYDNEQGPSDHPISPCGICRQSLLEFEQHSGHSIRLLLAGQSGKVFAILQSSLLLPLGFTNKDFH